MKNRLFILFLAAVMLLSLAACGGTADTPAASTDAPAKTETQPAAADAAVQNSPSVTGQYAYEESLPFDVMVWTLTLNEDGAFGEDAPEVTMNENLLIQRK